MSLTPWVDTAFMQIPAEVRANRLAHAILIEGGRGTGLELLAETVTQFRLCHQPPEQACGECKSCQLLRAGTHPDSKLIEPSGAGDVIKVDQIREAVDFLAQTPQIGDWKLVCILEAHRMNINASNALLKILEEPPGNSLLMLVTDRPQLLIPTVRSRCRKHSLPRPSQAEAKQYCLAEGVTEQQFDELVAILGPRPQEICEWVREGQLSRWTELTKGLEELAASKLTSTELTDRIKDLSLQEILEWLMQRSAAEAKLAKASPRVKWSGLYDWLVRARQDLERGTNPNRHLLLDECFLRWKAAFETGMRGNR